MKKEYPSIVSKQLLNIFFLIGPAVLTNGNLSPISFTEIDSYSSNVMTLNAWEMETLKVMSVEYVLHSNRAKDVSCPPPWQVEIEIDKKELSEGIKDFFASSKIKIKRVKRV